MRLLFLFIVCAGLVLADSAAFAQRGGGGQGGPKASGNHAALQTRVGVGTGGLETAPSLPRRSMRDRGRRGDRDVDYTYIRSLDQAVDGAEAEFDRFFMTPRAELAAGKARADFAEALDPLVAMLPDAWELPDYGEPGAATVRTTPLTDLKDSLVALQSRLTAQEQMDEAALARLYATAKSAEREIRQVSARVDKELAQLGRPN